MRLLEELEILLEEGPANSTFHHQYSTVLREIRDGWGRSPEQVRNEIHNASQAHPLLQSVVGLSRWIESGAYHGGAELAVEKFDESFSIAIDEGWSSTGAVLLKEWLRLLLQLGHEDAYEQRVEEAVSFLHQEEGRSIGLIFDLLDLIAEKPDGVPALAVENLLDYLGGRASDANEAEDFENGRKFWRYNLQIRQAENLDSETAKDGIVTTYQDHIESLRGEHHAVRASVAREAIRECVEWVNEERRVSWEQDYLEGNRQSIDEMGEYTHQPTEEEIGELDDTIESLIERFEELKEEHHGVFAIKWLVNLDILVPNPDSPNGDRAGLMDRVESRTVTDTGDSYSQEESGGDWPHMYSIAVQHNHNILQTIVLRLVNRDLLRQGDLFVLFNRREALSADTIAFLTDFVIAFYENRGAAATYIGMAQFEAAIRSKMEMYDKSTLRLDSDTGELHPRSMTGLLGQLDGEVSEAWMTYMRYRYTDLSGQNIRNKIAHGHLPYRHTQWGMSCIILFDLLRSFLELEEAFT